MSGNIMIEGVNSYMIANNLTCGSSMHPGELLREELEARRISQRALASQIGLSPTIISDIIHAKRSITTEYALLLEAALNIDADFWLKLQSDYNKDTARSNSSFMARLARIRQHAACL